jgi:hypothetical protein
MSIRTDDRAVYIFAGGGALLAKLSFFFFELFFLQFVFVVCSFLDVFSLLSELFYSSKSSFPSSSSSLDGWEGWGRVGREINRKYLLYVERLYAGDPSPRSV